ncbi:MAG TPA: RidA family protein [Candidatus Agrococcus pullicola]|uniref:RidA family protein n=1 Tax=Candidatus Agrococcus pullicola TaxID=2838429 RepID=A0A9D1YTL4_9MICO|nr:RidA family protein [Candidatus Agrococcus pullicola]
MSVAERLTELGLELPEVAAPVAAYVPAVISGNHVYVSGQLPFVDGALAATGYLGDEVTVEQGYELSRIAVLNGLAAVASVIGSLDRVTRIVKLGGFVASASGFTQQPAVINGASELLGEIFGDIGKHARAAVGVAELPLGTPVELELIVEFT